MKTKKSVVSIVICFLYLLVGCTANINRQGYKLDDAKVSEKECVNIIVVKSLNYNPTLVEIVGKISASDTGFSVKCSEAFVIENFKKDACAIGADIINITKDSRPDFWSTCYRAEAEFIKIKDKEILAKIKSDPRYSEQNISNRSKSTECMNQGIVVGALGGLIGSLILIGICNPSDTENDQRDTQSADSSDKSNIQENK